MTKLIAETAEVAAQWWADRLEQGDKAVFRQHLQANISRRLHERGMCCVECDYDPKDILLEAVRAAGIECKGHECSAKGILPMKTDTLIKPGVIIPTPGGPLMIACDVGHKDKTVTVVAKFDSHNNFQVLSIKEE